MQMLFDYCKYTSSFFCNYFYYVLMYGCLCKTEILPALSGPQISIFSTSTCITNKESTSYWYIVSFYFFNKTLQDVIITTLNPILQRNSFVFFSQPIKGLKHCNFAQAKRTCLEATHTKKVSYRYLSRKKLNTYSYQITQPTENFIKYK